MVKLCTDCMGSSQIIMILNMILSNATVIPSSLCLTIPGFGFCKFAWVTVSFWTLQTAKESTSWQSPLCHPWLLSFPVLHHGIFQTWAGSIMVASKLQVASLWNTSMPWVHHRWHQTLIRKVAEHPVPRTKGKTSLSWVVVWNMWNFHPQFGGSIQFDEHIFRMGWWFNHQLVSIAISFAGHCAILQWYLLLQWSWRQCSCRGWFFFENESSSSFHGYLPSFPGTCWTNCWGVPGTIFGMSRCNGWRL